MSKPQIIKPITGQESVWDYPRPPALEVVKKHIKVLFNQVVIADTNQAYRVLETSHPPGYYIPPSAVLPGTLTASEKTTFCEWKGKGSYYHVTARGKTVKNAAWYYDEPTANFKHIGGYVSFYPGLMDSCMVNDEKVIPQPGEFYGGWITHEIVGPFKGIPGSWGW